MWKVENREGLYRVVNGTRVWGANKSCTAEEAEAICTALNTLSTLMALWKGAPAHDEKP